MKRGLLLLLVGLGVAGCGGTASTVTTATSGTPKAKLIAAGDRICSAEDTAISKLNEKLRAATAATAPGVLREAAAVQHASIAELRALPLPAAAGERATVSRWLTAEGAVATDEMNVATATEPEGRQTAEQDIERAAVLAHDLAAGYGFKVCGAQG
jgi:hypothetical protein